MSRIATIAVCLTLLTLPVQSAKDEAEQWAKFRGPNAGTVADDPSLPDAWSETENVVWKTGIPGLGWSAPVVWDDHVFLTSAVSAGSKNRMLFS